jgi:hypothetical protein
MSGFVNSLVSSEREKETNKTYVKKSKEEVIAEISALEAEAVVLKFSEDREGTGLSPMRETVISMIADLKIQLEVETAMELEEQRWKEKEAEDERKRVEKQSETNRNAGIRRVWECRGAVGVTFRNNHETMGFLAIYEALKKHEPSLFSERDDPQNFQLLVKRAGNRDWFTDLKNHTQEEIYSEQRKVLDELKRIEDLYLTEPVVTEK